MFLGCYGSLISMAKMLQAHLPHGTIKYLVGMLYSQFGCMIRKKWIREIKEGLNSKFSDIIISFCGAFFKKRPARGIRPIALITVRQIS